MTRPPADDVATFFAAVQWLRSAWTTLPVAPAKLHTRDIDGQLGQRYSAPFLHLLDGSPTDVETVVEQHECKHEGQDVEKRRRGEICPRCGIFDGGLFDSDGIMVSPPKLIGERGTVSKVVARYRSPMSAALHRLSRIPPPAPDRPSSCEIVLALAFCGWELSPACQLLGMPIVSTDHRATMEALMLMSIRRLYNTYSMQPVPTHSKSESQLDAEGAA